MTRHLIAIGLLVCATGVEVSTWGGVGHHIIARIAHSQMTPAARQLVLELLGDEDFVGISTWADQVRPDRPESYNWHFVNVPYAARAYDPVRDCPPTDRGDCVIAAIERARLELASPMRSRERAPSRSSSWSTSSRTCTSRCTTSATAIAAATM
jgi:hypothetical protein